MDAKIKASLQAHFTSEEVAQIETFLDRGFSENGQVVIASIFLFASEHKKSVAEVLNECEKEWKRNWQFQHPGIKGDADAPAAAGIQNRSSLGNIYNALQIPSPLILNKTEIPIKAIVVSTKNSVYRFGEADQKGGRSVSRDGNPLDFSRCKIVSLGLGEEMELECLDGSHPSWYTTTIRSIE